MSLDPFASRFPLPTTTRFRTCPLRVLAVLLCLAVVSTTQAATTVSIGTDPSRTVIKGKLVTPDQVLDGEVVIKNWNQELPKLRAQVTPDPGGSAGTTLYGTTFKPSDIAPIPARDLGFGAPKWLGDGDTAVRAKGKDQINWTPTAAEG